jgi:esterase/lipase
MTLKTIYAIPGLGTTAELFNGIYIPGYKIKILTWPVPQKTWTMKEYTAEILKQIDTSEPINIMGVSFGGMLCCEIADMVPVKRIALISSCKTMHELPVMFGILRKVPFHRMLSEKRFRALTRWSRWIIGFEKKYMPEYLKMVHSMPDHYFSRCFNMIVTWKRKSNKDSIFHIHGDADRLLSQRNIRNFENIKGGNHAMIVYKAAEINSLLNNYFNGLPGTS